MADGFEALVRAIGALLVLLPVAHLTYRAVVDDDKPYSSATRGDARKHSQMPPRGEVARVVASHNRWPVRPGL